MPQIYEIDFANNFANQDFYEIHGGTHESMKP